MDLPLVSIIIPMYNQKPDYLKACLDGAINQTYQNIEIILSDNHSTNDSMKVVDNFTTNRLKIVKPLAHLNIIDHFTFAASHAKGEYISFLSSDDFIYPECIEKVVQPLIENKNLSFSYCENEIIEADGKRKSLVRNSQMSSGEYDKKEIAKRMYNNSEYWIIGGVIRHEFYKKTGFAKDIVAADWIMGFQLLKYGNVAYFNEILCAIRFHQREGVAKEKYADQYNLHQKQRIKKHNAVINDSELLNVIGISKIQACSYRDEEVLNSVIMIIREYYQNNVSKENVKEIFESYKEDYNSFNLNFLIKNYSLKIALYYTYLLGILKRVKRPFPKKYYLCIFT